MSQEEMLPTERAGEKPPPWPPSNRRQFVKTVVVGGLTWTAAGIAVSGEGAGKKPRFGRILADYGKCAGCRTCETVCAQANQKTEVDGAELWGLGNPHLSNIRVHHFNPDVDVATVCLMCEDNPCIKACPVKPDNQGRRALYRDAKTGTIRCDTKRCVTCGQCAKACVKKRVGAIVPDPKSGVPQRMCTLCGGEPKCVKYCPYGALEFQAGRLKDTDRAVAPETIAKRLAVDLYGPQDQTGGDQQ